MKSTFLFLMSVLIVSSAFAQEVEEKSYASATHWSDETKIGLAIVWGIICMFFAVRTFRNKPEA